MPPDRWKRGYVMPFFAGIGAILVHSVWMLVETGGALAWFGPTLVTGSFVSFLASMLLTRSPRTSRRLPGLLTAASGGVLTALAGVVAGTTPAGLPVFYALAAFAGVVAYVFWYSELDRVPSRVLRVGATLPDFVLETEDGRPISSSVLRGRPVVWLFFRGNWCPLCMAQIREIAAQYAEIDARGARVALVSPQTHELTRELAARHAVPFLFLVDRGGRAASALGITHEGGVPLGIRGYGEDTVYPTAVVTDADGRILLADQTDNYRVRPEPETFLAVLDRCTAERVRSPRPALAYSKEEIS